MTKLVRTYKVEKTAFSVNGVGKFEQLHVKEDVIKTFSSTI